jgi:RNA polymerase sigma-70 factor (ECF subfamily)
LGRLRDRWSTNPYPIFEALLKEGTTRRWALEFDEFYRTSYRRVDAATFAFAGNEEVAADAAQEAFVRAFARWARLRNEHWIEGWVMTTAMNLCRRSVRHRVRIRQPQNHSTTVAAPNASAVDVASALRRLPPRQRVAVVLHYLPTCPCPTSPARWT